MTFFRRSRRWSFASALVLVSGACASGAASGVPVPTPTSEASEAMPELREGDDFVVYLADGRRASMADLVSAMADYDVVFLGEEHNDPITHRVHARLLESAYSDHAEGRPLVLSLEMFERDVQYVVDEYLDDLITESHFRSSARPWDNYETDYRPMVEFAKAHDLEVVAANAPRRYVNRASRLGRASLDALGPDAVRYLPPLPYPEASAAYQAEWDALMGEAAGHMRGSPLDGQTLWDASMAHAVAGALERSAGALVLHVAGGFHIENATGTPEALEHYRPGTSALIVAARPADDPTTWDAERLAGLGDYVIVTRRPTEG